MFLLEDDKLMDLECGSIDPVCSSAEWIITQMGHGVTDMSEFALQTGEFNAQSPLFASSIGMMNSSVLGPAIYVMIISAIVGITWGLITQRSDLIKRSIIGALISFPVTVLALTAVAEGLTVVDDVAEGFVTQVTGPNGLHDTFSDLVEVSQTGKYKLKPEWEHLSKSASSAIDNVAEHYNHCYISALGGETAYKISCADAIAAMKDGTLDDFIDVCNTFRKPPKSWDSTLAGCPFGFYSKIMGQDLVLEALGNSSVKDGKSFLTYFKDELVPKSSIALLVVFLAILLIGLFVVALAMAFHTFALMLLIAFAPLGFVLLPASGGDLWVKRWAGMVVATALAKPIVFGTLALLVSSWSSVPSLTDPAVIVLIVGVLVAGIMPLALMTMFSFAASDGGEGGLGSRGGGALGAKTMMMSRTLKPNKLPLPGRGGGGGGGGIARGTAAGAKAGPGGAALGAAAGAAKQAGSAAAKGATRGATQPGNPGTNAPGGPGGTPGRGGTGSNGGGRPTSGGNRPGATPPPSTPRNPQPSPRFTPPRGPSTPGASGGKDTK